MNITWTQGSETTFFLYDSNGRPLTLTAGRSYLALVSSLTGQELTVQTPPGKTCYKQKRRSCNPEMNPKS